MCNLNYFCFPSHGHPGWTDSLTPSHTGRVHQIDLGGQTQLIMWHDDMIWCDRCDTPSWANLFLLPAFVEIVNACNWSLITTLNQSKHVWCTATQGLHLFSLQHVEEHHNFRWFSSIGKQPFYGGEATSASPKYYYIGEKSSSLLILPSRIKPAKRNHGSVGQWISISAIILQLVGWEPQETASSKHLGRFFETRIFQQMGGQDWTFPSCILLLFAIRTCPVTSGDQQLLTPKTRLQKKPVRIDKESGPRGSHDMYSGHVIEMSHEHV